MVRLADLEKTLYASSGNNPDPISIDFSPGSDHIALQTDLWTVSAWREDEVQFKGTHIIDQIEKVEAELANDLFNGKNTVARPIYFENAYNKLTLIGLTESAKRDTGETSTTLTHNSIGTDSTAATESDVNLGAEDTGGSYARKAYATDGQRKVTSQTAKYGMLWDDGDVSAVPLSIKESGVHWHVSNANSMHARVTFTTFSMSSGDLFVTQINELHQNG